MMRASTALDFQEYRLNAGESVGFIPTMGALHAGHESLIRLAREACDQVVVSIFVNPTQFAPHEDFDAYPRSIDADLLYCDRLGVDCVFTPSVCDVYPNNDYTQTYSPDPNLAGILCGKSRPHFFDGVCNVVNRLLNIVRPSHVYFGKKDLQQATIIKQMILDCNHPIELVCGDIIRDENGLALSSRNQYLTSEQYERALVIPNTLHDAILHAIQQQWDAFQLRQFVAAQIEARGLKGDYVDVFRPTEHTLVTSNIQPGDYCCVGAYVDDIRLIDNQSIFPLTT